MTVAVGEMVRVTRCCLDGEHGCCEERTGKVGRLLIDEPGAGVGPPGDASFRYYVEGVGSVGEVERAEAAPPVPPRTFKEALAAIHEIAKSRGDSACLELSTWVHRSGGTETRLKVWSTLDNASYSASSYADVVERYRARCEDSALIDGAGELEPSRGATEVSL